MKNGGNSINSYDLFWKISHMSKSRVKKLRETAKFYYLKGVMYRTNKYDSSGRLISNHASVGSC